MPLAQHRFTVDEYLRMGAAGVFREDDRVELIDGQVVEMTPIGPEHAGCVDTIAQLFAQRVGAASIVRVQNPIVLGSHAAPQPDVALVRPRPRGYRAQHPGPTEILLVIEVADTSIEYDRDVKIPRYARAGIPEAWLVNLAAGQLEVFRNPTGDRYTTRRVAEPGETVTPIALTDVAMGVDEILG